MNSLSLLRIPYVEKQAGGRTLKKYRTLHFQVQNVLQLLKFVEIGKQKLFLQLLVWEAKGAIRTVMMFFFLFFVGKTVQYSFEIQ